MHITLRFKSFLLLLFVFLSCGLHAGDGLRIKVLLDSVSRSNAKKVVFSCKSGEMAFVCEKNPIKKIVSGGQVTIVPRKKTLEINGEKFPSQIIRVSSQDGHVTYKNKTYDGVFYVYPTQAGVDIVNKVPLEDYITSVVRTEAWPRWPIEAYKVQAVASRTYVIHQMQHAQKQKRHYHVVATNAHQTYTGVHTCKEIKEAVNDTAGIFVAYNGQPILAMYDACCGGVDARKDSRSIVARTPYLARPERCTFCSSFKIYSWHKKLPIKTIVRRLQPVYPNIKNIKKITQRVDAAGLVQEVIITNKHHTYHIPGKTFHALCTEVPSFLFTMEKHGDYIHVKGNGYGHQIGLCQWGSYELVRRGWDYKKILDFYYPGTTLMKLRYKSQEPKPEVAASEEESKTIAVEPEVKPAVAEAVSAQG